MITDAILDAVFAFIDAVIGVFPDNTLDLSGLGEGSAYLGWVGLVVDMTVLAGVVGTIAAIELALVGVRFSLFVWRLLPLS